MLNTCDSIYIYINMHSRVVAEQNQCDDNAYMYEVNVSSCSELYVGPSGFKPQPVAKQAQVSK